MKSKIWIVLGFLVAATAAGVWWANKGDQTPDASQLETATAPSPEGSVAPNSENPQGTTPMPTSSNAPDLTVDANGLSKAVVVLKTTHGIVKFRFYPQDAPQTVARLVELIQQKFYNGLTFHRVIDQFVAQTGDPLGNGTGGSGKKLKAEFNKRQHMEGTVAMARASDPDSADSQFYICLGRLPHLDGKYTVFGQVTEGMEAVKKIRVGDKIEAMALE